MNGIAVFVAIVALASAAEDKRQGQKPEDKPTEGQQQRGGLQWPLPDPSSEGDLILHGAHFYDRVGELRKAKVDNDVDRMILAFGRNFLRRAHKYLEATPDFKVPSVLCRDTRALNSTRRWQIRIQPETQPTASENQDQTQEKQQQQGGQNNEQQSKQQQQQNDAPQSNKQQQQQNDPPKQQQQQNEQKNAKSKQITNNDDSRQAPNATIEQPPQRGNTYEEQEDDFYERMGSNFARLLVKKYRKENLITEETEYLDHWLEQDEAVHYGVVGIYCQEGENVKEIVKQLSAYIDEKQQ